MMGFFRVTISLIFYTNLSVHGTLIYTEVENLHKALTNISKDIKPRVNQTDRVNIDVLLSVNAIQDYDEISGTLTFTASFLFQWNDEFKTWENNKYGGITATKLPVLKTWMPVLHLRHGVDSNSLFTYRNNMDIKTSTKAYFADGTAIFGIIGMYQISCESDVTYYPFDEHKCVISLLTLYFLSETTLTSMFGIDSGASSPHAEWAIKANSTKAVKRSLTIQVAASTTIQDQIDFTIIIKREHRFPILNIVLPVTSLSLVQTFVFLLPVDSGERTSFSFTLILTLVVFMTMTSERLPPSNNISIINMYLLHQLFSSILTTALVVFSIRLYYKDEHSRQDKIVYRLILFIYLCSLKSCFNRRKNEDDTSDEQDTMRNDTKPCWENVAMFFDKMCLWFLFLTFVIAQTVYGLVFILH